MLSSSSISLQHIYFLQLQIVYWSIVLFQSTFSWHNNQKDLTLTRGVVLVALLMCDLLFLLFFKLHCFVVHWMTDSFLCKVFYTNIGASNYHAKLPAKPRVSTISHHNLMQRRHVNLWICNYYQRLSSCCLWLLLSVSEQHWSGLDMWKDISILCLHPVSAAVCTPENKYLAVKHFLKSPFYIICTFLVPNLGLDYFLGFRSDKV